MRGDRSALEAVWLQARRWVAVVLTAAGARSADLPDLMQETACGLTRGIGALRDAAAFRPWLRRLALNALHGAHRRPGPSALEVEPCAPSEPGSAERDEVRAVRAALAALPPTYREPLLLRSVEGLSQRAVAEMLGVPETTIETRLARARRLLRAALARRCAGTEACIVPRERT